MNVDQTAAPASDSAAEPATMTMKLELVLIGVSDVDRAKAFYVDKVGFHADHDQRVSDTVRFVQLTPPGSACSIAFGTGFGHMEPGAAKGLQVVVDDTAAIRRHLVERGVQVSEIDVKPWGIFVYFQDPDGNAWSVQQLVPRPSNPA